MHRPPFLRLLLLQSFIVISHPVTAASVEMVVPAGVSRQLKVAAADVTWSSAAPHLVHVSSDGVAYGRASRSGGSALVSGREPDGTEHCFLIHVPPYVPPFDTRVSTLSASDAECLRSRLVEAIWPVGGFPATRLPDLIETATGPVFPTHNTATLDRLTIEMGANITVTAFVIHPINANGEYVVYIDGHSDLEEGRFPIPAMLPADYFLRLGYAVAVVSPPLYGGSYRPLFSYHGAPKVRLNHHDQLWLLEDAATSPFKFFLEPVAAVVNHIIREFSKRPAAVVGFSGGATMALLYAAVDDRIPASFLVGGFVSPELTWGHWGDYEQIAPELYDRIASHRDLMVLGTFPGRTQVQVLLINDSTSMAAGAERLYADDVADAANRVSGGRFVMTVDATTFGHEVTPFALSEIDRQIRSYLD